MICKNCDTEMVRVFSYDTQGEGSQIRGRRIIPNNVLRVHNNN